jgi:hypothetical protein
MAHSRHAENKARGNDAIKKPLERPRSRLQSAPQRSIRSAVAVVPLDDTLLGLSVLAAKEVGRGCPRPHPEVSEGAVDDGLSDESKESVLGHELYAFKKVLHSGNWKPRTATLRNIQPLSNY